MHTTPENWSPFKSRGKTRSCRLNPASSPGRSMQWKAIRRAAAKRGMSRMCATTEMAKANSRGIGTRMATGCCRFQTRCRSQATLSLPCNVGKKC
eukprot:1452886-Amphidinium_carterae.1